MRRIIITGTGGSGTAYMAALLHSVGIACGHERVFTNVEGEIDWGGFVAESSWLAVPRLRFCHEELVVHLVRDPLRVAQSMVRFFDPQGPLDDSIAPWKAQRDVIRWIFPEVFRSADPIERFCSYYRLWNAEIERRADLRVRIEDVDERTIVRLCEHLGHMYDGHLVVRALADLPTNYNSHSFRDPTIQWSQIEQIADMAERYGYRR